MKAEEVGFNIIAEKKKKTRDSEQLLAETPPQHTHPKNVALSLKNSDTYFSAGRS